MNASSERDIEHACTKLANRFTHIIDIGTPSQVAELFAEDGVFGVPGKTMQGRDAIRETFKARDNSSKISKHVCTNIVIDVIDDNHAKGVCYMTLYKYDGEKIEGPAPLEGAGYVGHYLDQYVRVDGQWLFAQRCAEVIFLQPESNCQHSRRQ